MEEYFKNQILGYSQLFAKPFAWDNLQQLNAIIERLILNLDPKEYDIKSNIAIHKNALIEQNVMMKGPVIIGKNCLVAANSYLRNGVIFLENVSVGPGCEVKSSVIFKHSSLAHFNFVGDSILGNKVNLEAGSIIANHYNERADKEVFAKVGDQIFSTATEKFGAFVGDGCKIGANAVLSPGTILAKNTVVHRLELIDQTKDFIK